MKGTADDVFEDFARVANDDGVIAFPAFYDVALSYIDRNDDLSDMDRERAEMVLTRLFQILDSDDNGVVDFAELASGISPLCGGTQDEKATACFELYDVNGDGKLSLDELTDYLHNVFRVVYETEPHAAKASGVSPLELAVATARTVFDEAGGDHDYLTLAQFKAWFTQSGNSAVASTVRDAPNTMSLATVRKLSHLDSYSTIGFWRVYGRGGRLWAADKDAFNRAFEVIFRGQAKWK